jgi:DNA processing protein
VSASALACDERFAPLSAQRRFAWAVAARAALTNSLTVSALLADIDVEQVAERLCTDPELLHDRAAAVEALLLTPEDPDSTRGAGAGRGRSPDWPTAAVADLERANIAAPVALWVRGPHALTVCVDRPVAVTGRGRPPTTASNVIDSSRPSRQAW